VVSRRTAFGAVLSATVLAVTAACGGGGPAQQGGGTSSGPDLTGETLEVAATWSGIEQENFKAVLDAFAAKTHAKVNYTSGGNDLANLINSRLAGGKPPDVALIAQPGVVADFAKKGSIKPANDAVKAAVDKNFAGAWKKLGTVDGKLYGVWFKVANKSTVWYRADKFTDAGVQPPKTFDEVATTGKTLIDAGLTPFAVPGGDGWPLTDWFENVYLRVAGADKYDKLATHDLPWTDQSVVDTLTILGTLWNTPKAIEGGPTGALQLTFTQSVADVFGDKPKAVMLFEGDFVAGEIAKAGSLKVGDKAKFFDFPSVKGSPPSVVVAGDQAVAFKDSKGAQALLEYLASPEAAAVWAKKGGYLSANKNLDTASYADPTTKQLAEAVVKAGDAARFDLSDLTPTAFGGTSGADMWRLLQEFLRGPSDAKATAQKLEDAAKKAYGR